MTDIKKESNDESIGVKCFNLFLTFIDILVFLSKLIYVTLEGILFLFVKRKERNVSNDIVLITGTGHGIGKELAKQYAALGATVIGWDINEKNNQETVKEIKELGGIVHGYKVDVSSRDEIRKCIAIIKRDIGIVTIIVNNAGIMPTHKLIEHTDKEIDNIFNINVMAHLWIIKELLLDMIEKNIKGHVVALSSVAGLVGLNNLVPYCGTKFAVRGIMEALHEELRNDPRKPNIKFTSVYPYMVDTGLCKKPHMRFPALMSLVKPDEAAAAIISAQRSGQSEVSIPTYVTYLNAFTRLFPSRAADLLKDFLDSGVDSDL